MIPAAKILFVIPLLWGCFHLATPRSEAWAEAILLLGPCALVPLGHRLMAASAGHPVAERVRLSGAISAALLVPALWLPPGWLAGFMALPWLGFAVAMAWQYRAFASRGLGGACLFSSWLFLVVGAMWLLADRLAYQPLGFHPVLVRLTAIHFHHAGFSAPLLAGLATWRWNNPACWVTCLLMIAGVPLTAAGITSTRLGGPFWIESSTASVMVLAAIGVVGCQTRLAITPRFQGIHRVGLIGSSLCLAAGAALALSYAWRFHIPAWIPDIPSMRAIHGTLNAIGFGWLGLWAWTGERQPFKNGS